MQPGLIESKPVQRVAVVVAYQDARTFGEKCSRDGQPNALGAAGDKHPHSLGRGAAGGGGFHERHCFFGPRLWTSLPRLAYSSRIWAVTASRRSIAFSTPAVSKNLAISG